MAAALSRIGLANGCIRTSIMSSAANACNVHNQIRNSFNRMPTLKLHIAVYNAGIHTVLLGV